MMLKKLVLMALAATSSLALGPVIDKNPGFEVAGATAALAKYWDTSGSPTCTRVTTGKSPAGNARLICNLNSTNANPVSFTQPLALKKQDYTVGAMVKFHLPPPAGMDMTIFTGGQVMYKTRACGYAFNGMRCYQSAGVWHTVGGDEVLISGKNQTEILKVQFHVFKPNGSPTFGSVEIDQLLFRVGNQN